MAARPTGASSPRSTASTSPMKGWAGVGGTVGVCWRWLHCALWKCGANQLEVYSQRFTNGRVGRPGTNEASLVALAGACSPGPKEALGGVLLPVAVIRPVGCHLGTDLSRCLQLPLCLPCRSPAFLAAAAFPASRGPSAAGGPSSAACTRRHSPAAPRRPTACLVAATFRTPWSPQGSPMI